MPNLVDYVMWRGDLSFIQAPFCEVDGAVLSAASYFDYDIIIDDDELHLPTNYKRVITDYIELDGDDIDIKLGLIFPTQKYVSLMKLLMRYPRFGDVEISDFVNEANNEYCYQFCAMTFHLNDGSLAVVFRGTDDTVVGWKEDFCLSYMDEIPSQKLSVDYIEFIAEKYPDKPIHVCGHSKGGNLAVYSTVMSSKNVQDRIVKAYCYDGPGLSYSNAETEAYKEMSSRICTFLPQASTIGTIFNNGSFRVVKSKGASAYQHDILNWEVRGQRFLKLKELTRSSQKSLDGFKDKMSLMSAKEKENFIKLLFDAIDKTGARTLMDLNESRMTNLSTFVKSIGSLSKDEKDLMAQITKKLFK